MKGTGSERTIWAWGLGPHPWSAGNGLPILSDYGRIPGIIHAEILPESATDMRDSYQGKDEMGEFMFLGLRMTEGVSEEEFQEYFRELSVEKIYGESDREI